MSIINKVLSITKDLRIKHEKRNEARNYLESYRGLLMLPSRDISFKISLGYLERFLIKAYHEQVDKNFENGILEITEWTEGCGFFEGKYKVVSENNISRVRSFQWAGVGKIEETWNMFSKF